MTVTIVQNPDLFLIGKFDGQSPADGRRINHQIKIYIYANLYAMFSDQKVVRVRVAKNSTDRFGPRPHLLLWRGTSCGLREFGLFT